MIIFHEGLPRSGKSYAACVDHIVPSLKNGRKVFAYIEGLNHEKFAEVTELPLERVQELLVQIEADQVKEIYKHVEKDSFVVIDELQDFFPAGRQRQTDEITRFITQHGHDGLDILCMGQDLRDCHALWKRRVQRKIVFTKLTAVGKDDSYKWEACEAKAGEKFQKISSGVKKYDPKYFGLYASHTTGTTNTFNYQDDRINILKSKAIRLGLPVFGIVLFAAIYYLVSFFSEPSVVKIEEPTQSPESVSSPVVATQAAPSAEPPYPAAPQSFSVPLDYFDEFASAVGNRVRLGGIIDYGPGRGFEAFIEIVDVTAYRLKESFSLRDLQEMGWRIKRLSYGLEIFKEGKRYIASSWPMESWGKVSEYQKTQMVQR